jgi:hypothetical protein
MRPGVERIATEEEDRLMLELQGPFLYEVASRRGKLMGSPELGVISYEPLVELYVPLSEHFLAVSLEKDVPFAELPEIARKIKDLPW